MSVHVNIHRPTTMRTSDLDRDTYALEIDTDYGHATLYTAPHVAEATAAAFNRAMQAQPDTRGGFTYKTDRQHWIIESNPDAGWRAHSEEVTGDGDPSWLFADAPSLMALLDEIDATEKDNGCETCADIPGLDNLNEVGRGKDMQMICDDCLKKLGEHEQAMREMADDDRAHAWRENQ